MRDIDRYIKDSYLDFDFDGEIEDRVDCPRISINDIYKYNLHQGGSFRLVGGHTVFDRICVYPVRRIEQEIVEGEICYRVSLGNAIGINSYELGYGGTVRLRGNEMLEVVCSTINERILWALHLQLLNKLNPKEIDE